MSILSTVQAIQLGIESIEARTDIPPRKKEQAIKLLSSLEQSEWYQNWTKDSIIKALNDYREKNGRAPTVTNLKEHGMPKGVTIQSVFNMKPSLLLKRLFPENRNQRHVDPELANPYGFDKPEDWINCFAEQFNKHKKEGMNCRQFNLLRDEGTPTWETVARHCKIATWTDLMKKAGVKYIRPKRETAHNLELNNFKSPICEKLDAINRERRQILDEFIELVNEREQKEREFLKAVADAKGKAG